jgi:hypothetical protein
VKRKILELIERRMEEERKYYMNYMRLNPNDKFRPKMYRILEETYRKLMHDISEMKGE